MDNFLVTQTQSWSVDSFCTLKSSCKQIIWSTSRWESKMWLSRAWYQPNSFEVDSKKLHLKLVLSSAPNLDLSKDKFHHWIGAVAMLVVINTTFSLPPRSYISCVTEIQGSVQVKKFLKYKTNDWSRGRKNDRTILCKQREILDVSLGPPSKEKRVGQDRRCSPTPRICATFNPSQCNTESKLHTSYNLNQSSPLSFLPNARLASY
jgi:hypothetical protein